jgi:hypothetical protein
MADEMNSLGTSRLLKYLVDPHGHHSPWDVVASPEDCEDPYEQSENWLYELKEAARQKPIPLMTVVQLSNEQDERISHLESRIAEVELELRRRTDAVRKRFYSLLERWKNERGPTSFLSKMCMNDAYQQIIGLGEQAMPLLLSEMEKNPGHYDWALRAITGEDPVPKESRGKLKEMAEIWVQWGRDNGYSW